MVNYNDSVHGGQWKCQGCHKTRPFSWDWGCVFWVGVGANTNKTTAPTNNRKAKNQTIPQSDMLVCEKDRRVNFTAANQENKRNLPMTESDI